VRVMSVEVSIKSYPWSEFVKSFERYIAGEIKYLIFRLNAFLDPKRTIYF
jgi:hypothetical protein